MSVDRQGYSLAAEYYTGPWIWAFDGQEFDYSQDLSEVDTNIRLQRFLGEQTLTQLFSLTKWKINGSVSYQWARTTLRAGVVRYELAVDKVRDNNIYTTVDHQLNHTVSIGFNLAQSLQEPLTYGELLADDLKTYRPLAVD